MHGIRGLFLIAMAMAATASARAQSEPYVVSAAWWNVENLFDTRDDPATNDDAFTPQGERHWSRRRLDAKIKGIFKTLTLMQLPDVVGLGEVENKYVLRELCQGTPLQQVGYRYVHYDSPDPRGIDVAFLYRADRFVVDSSRSICVSDSSEGFLTRDILLVCGHTPDSLPLCFLINHWPSKKGGEQAEQRRLQIAQTLRQHMLRLHQEHPEAAIIAMGDMNSTAEEAPMTEGFAFGTDNINPEGIRNLTLRLPKAWGTHKYQGQWNYLDQVLLLSGEGWFVGDLKLLRYEHLLTHERRGQRPLRTYQGPRYEGGLSDHLPLLLRLKHIKQ